MIELVRKPVPLPAFELVDQAAMLEALTFLAGEGWRGALSQSDDGWSLMAESGCCLLLRLRPAMRRSSDDIKE